MVDNNEPFYLDGTNKKSKQIGVLKDLDNENFDTMITALGNSEVGLYEK